MPQTAQELHHEAVEANRDIPVVPYKSGQKQSDLVYEVTDGYKRLPGGLVLGPGQRFHPTEKQVRDGSLKNKARELSRSEYRDLRAPRKSFGVGADIGIRALPMAEGTLQLALEAGLTEEDFKGVDPEGSGARYTRAQVETMIAQRHHKLPEA